ncbi:hypothetical protein [Salinarimonas sp.]|uniref:hypothetical protein n=1 Tax=Salinarimonas sp. TaxID=2766526 RepID=UPI0032D92D78
MAPLALGDLWRIRQGRRAAVAALAPFVDRSRARRATALAATDDATASETDTIGRAAGLDRLAALGDVSDTSDSVWLDPYLIGYLGTLITLTAKRKTGPLNEEALAGVQETAWTRLTGLDGSLFGTEILLLSRTPTGAFRAGCRNGAAFFSALTGEPVPPSDETPDWAVGLFHVPAPESAAEGAIPEAQIASTSPFEAWDRFVDARLMDRG